MKKETARRIARSVHLVLVAVDCFKLAYYLWSGDPSFGPGWCEALLLAFSVLVEVVESCLEGTKH